MTCTASSAWPPTLPLPVDVTARANNLPIYFLGPGAQAVLDGDIDAIIDVRAPAEYSGSAAGSPGHITGSYLIANMLDR